MIFQAEKEEQAAKEASQQKQEDFTQAQESWNPDVPMGQTEGGGVTDVRLLFNILQ